MVAGGLAWRKCRGLCRSTLNSIQRAQHTQRRRCRRAAAAAAWAAEGRAGVEAGAGLGEGSMGAAG
jgi:hypothetical protein